MKTIKRETRQTIFEVGQERPMMVEVSDGGIFTWPKGTRRRAAVNLVAEWQRAMWADVNRKRVRRVRRKFYSRRAL